MNTFHIDRPAVAADVPAICTAISESFGFEPADAESWFEYAGHDQVVGLRAGAAVIGGLVQAPMGQYFGGRSVPTAGIAGVGVVPEWRRRGAARALMTAVLQDLHAEGVALSTLYASTHGLYARVGFGAAGTRHVAEIDARSIRAPRSALTVARLDESHRPAMKALYTERARSTPGHLDRGHYVWHRTFRGWHGKPSFATGIFDGDRLAGYVVWRHRAQAPYYDVTLLDVVAPTIAAAGRIWQFLADHNTFGRVVRGGTAPNDPFWLALPHPGPSMKLGDIWMLRLVHLPAAIAARGFAPELKAAIALTVTDPTLPKNAGSWTLEVEQGEGRLEPGSVGGVEVSIEGFAALYSGFQTCAQLRARGLLSGNAADAARLDRLFCGPAPWMPDMF